MLKERKKEIMIEIITSKIVRRGITEHEYEGTAKLEDIAQKQAIIDLLDRNNFGGCIDVRTTDKKNIYKFNAIVYID